MGCEGVEVVEHATKARSESNGVCEGVGEKHIQVKVKLECFE